MKTITAALFATALSGAVFGAPAQALAAPSDVGPLPARHEQLCPGSQPFGFNGALGVDAGQQNCHTIGDDDGDDDPDLDGDVPNMDLGQGLPPTYKDGDYPPDYDWSEKYGDDHGGGH